MRFFVILHHPTCQPLLSLPPIGDVAPYQSLKAPVVIGDLEMGKLVDDDVVYQVPGEMGQVGAQGQDTLR